MAGKERLTIEGMTKEQQEITAAYLEEARRIEAMDAYDYYFTERIKPHPQPIPDAFNAFVAPKLRANGFEDAAELAKEIGLEP